MVSALTCNFKLVRISYIDGCITFYPNFQFYDADPNLRNCLKAVVKACDKKDFKVVVHEDKKPTETNLKFVDMLGNLQFGADNYSRYIIREDVDHWLYHKDNYDYNDSHYHVKFQSLLTPDLLSLIIKVCVTFKLLTIEEGDEFLEALANRYQSHRDTIDSLLTGNKCKDVTIISEHIVQCEANDILSNLHDYLLTDKFAYLRSITSTETDKHWQGTIRNDGCVGKVSAEWACIEKNISLQLIKNITSRCSGLDQKTSKAYACELNHALLFFSIKRKDSSRKKINNAYEAFEKADVEALNAKYQRMIDQLHDEDAQQFRSSKPGG